MEIAIKYIDFRRKELKPIVKTFFKTKIVVLVYIFGPFKKKFNQ